METCSCPVRGTGTEVAIRAEHQDGNKLGVKAGCIAGLKKSRYNNQDFGCIVMSSYAAPISLS